MKKTRILVFALAAGLGLGLGAAACGDDDGGGGGSGGGGTGGECAGATATLAGTCVEASGDTCTEWRGSITAAQAQPECENGGDTWTTGATCPTASQASGACVITIAGITAVTYSPNYTPTDWRQGCEQAGGCYLAP